MAATAYAGAPGTQLLTPGFVHEELIKGNQRFASGHPKHPHSSLKWIKQAGKTDQHPHAVVLCCSDSRVSPEILFDQGIGDLFVVRVAGNVANEDEIGSIEYAAEHLGIPLCLVLGHSGCGAVKAVVGGDALPKEIEHLVVPIQHAMQHVKTAHNGIAGPALVQATVTQNVQETVNKLRQDVPILTERIHSRRFSVEGAVYDLETGRVTWLPAQSAPSH